MRIRCQIIDFYDVKPSASSKKKTKNAIDPEKDSIHPLIRWAQNYFQTGLPPSAWDETYLEEKSNSSCNPTSSILSREPLFIPPVYFQQQGHSRTLVGKLSYHLLS